MITIVSGLPRSGTSLVMQMLSAGGMPVLTDRVRTPDEDNPRGYLEWEPVKRLRQEPLRILEAEDKVVKVVSPLLTSLPLGHPCRVIFLLRPLQQILASQAEMMRRRSVTAPNPAESVLNAYQEHLQEVFAWMERRTQLALLTVQFEELLGDPASQAERMRRFVDLDLDLDAMIRAVVPALHHQRS